MKNVEVVRCKPKKWMIELLFSGGNFIRIIFTVVFLVILFCPIAQAESLFVMGWDGAGLNNVVPLLEQGKLPNLKVVLDNGACLMHIENISKTCTAPNWVECFTGLTYDQTGVKKNINRPLLSYTWIITQAIQAKGHKIGCFASKSLLSKTVGASALANAAIYADSYLEVGPDSGGDTYIEQLANRTISFISSNTDYFVFLHVDPDYYGHIYGENSDRYLQEFERSDYWFGEVMKHIDLNNTRIIVVSDHGFDEGKNTHENAPDNFMVTDIPLKSFYCTGETTGTMRDIANSILEYYGIDWTSRKPTMRGKSLLQN